MTTCTGSAVQLAVAGMSLVVYPFVPSFSSRDVLGEIWDRIEPVLENFPTYFFII